MILIDANLLLYAYDAASSHHDGARAWLERTLSAPAPVGLSWIVVLAFLRIATDARISASALTVGEASAAVSSWLARPNVALLEPTERHWAVLARLLDAGQARGPLVMDAHLAALAIEHGATLCTTDRDFTRFPGLSVRNPLEPV